MSSPFTLHPITPTDIPELTSIFTSAFSTDPNTSLKLAGKNPTSQAEGMAHGIHHWLTNPQSTTLLKAVENSTGTIMGWVGWARRGFDDQPKPAVPTGIEEGVTNPNSEERDLDGVARLESVCGRDMNRWVSKIMPAGTKCRYVVSCLVHPSYQGRGVGKALVEWGTDKADREGLFCWVHSSDGGEVFYEKMGFKEVERFTVDLDAFAEGPKEGGGYWGNYIFRYMVRQARDVKGGM